MPEATCKLLVITGSVERFPESVTVLVRDPRTMVKVAP